MEKRCRNCTRPYFARWRNEAVELCGNCRASAVLCEHCQSMIRPPRDLAQLSLLNADVEIRILQDGYHHPPPPMEDRYWSLRAKASQATRRKYPYC
jgi:hypothetical protein